MIWTSPRILRALFQVMYLRPTKGNNSRLSLSTATTKTYAERMHRLLVYKAPTI